MVFYRSLSWFLSLSWLSYVIPFLILLLTVVTYPMVSRFLSLTSLSWSWPSRFLSLTRLSYRLLHRPDPPPWLLLVFLILLSLFARFDSSSCNHSRRCIANCFHISMHDFAKDSLVFPHVNMVILMEFCMLVDDFERQCYSVNGTRTDMILDVLVN